MTSDTPANPARRLEPGDRLGPHSVVAFRGADEAGERYEVFFGTTNHEADLYVPPAGAAAPTAADYAAFVSAVSGVRHPCVLKFFAAGEDDAPDGSRLPWLRCEHPRGFPAERLESPVDGGALPDDGDGPFAPTAGALFAACRGRLAAADRDGLVCDLLAGLAHLHSLGLPCGHLDPDEIPLDRLHGLERPLARIASYAWGAEGGGSPADDLRGAAAFVRAAAAASATVSPDAESARLCGFADALDAGSFESAAAAAAAFDAIAAQNGHADAGTRPDPDAPAEDEEEADASARAEPRRRSRRGGSGLAGRSEVARRLSALAGVAAVVAFVSGVGVAVYFYLSSTAEKERRRIAARLGPPQPAVLVIPTERPPEDLFAELPGSVFDYTPEQLQLVAGAPEDPRHAAAAARLALSHLDEADEDALPAAFEEWSPELARCVPELRARAGADTAAAFLFARAQLLGIGTQRDPAAAYRAIVKATREGLREADLLFGDVLASDVAIPDLRAESRIERDRRAVASWRRASGSDANPSHLLHEAADRIATMLRSGRGIPPVNNDYPQWLGRCAEGGHVASLAALSVPGGFAPDDPAEALKWLRLLARNADAGPEWRAWAQSRMAGMFERGEGTPPSASAARKMLERAADGGNGPAMLALAAALDKSGDAAERTAAAEWRRRAREAAPEPVLELRTAVVKPPASWRLRAAAKGELLPSAAPERTASPEDEDEQETVSLSGDANRAAILPVVPVRAAAAGPSVGDADAPLVPLTEEPAAGAEKPAQKKAKPDASASGAKAAPDKKGAWPPKGNGKTAVDPARKKDSAK